ncbi:MAG: protease [Bacteroidetes bacterium]|nr:protease [Bacteroidota bacterium]
MIRKYGRIVFCTILSLFPFIVQAQISFGGTPPSFSITKSKFLDGVPVKTIVPQENIAQLKEQDIVAKQNGAPPIVAVLTPTQLDLMKEGAWTKVSGDSVCRLSIKSPDAQGIMLYYDKFKIPDGGKLYIYNGAKNQLLGAYTNQTNQKGGRFSTEIIYGDSLTLEYFHPEGQEKPEIIISKIGYCYNLIEMIPTTGNSLLRATTYSSDCYVDINCSPEGDNWQQQKKGVAKLIVPIGNLSYLCSGSLVNNVYQDQTPYFLSAHHCFEQDGQTADFSTMQFYFHYELATCGESTVSSKMKTMVGADLLVDIPLKGGSDGTLLRLKDSIPADYDVFYNGWDITTVAPTSGAVIHHPSGDVKKISIYTATPTTTTFIDLEDTCTIGAHWSVVYSETTNGFSVTAGGSSGSPMFNQDGRIVGTLTGGESYCSTPTAADYYGKFRYHWNKASSSSEWMSNYLDAPDYPVQAINGIDGYTKGDTLKGENFINIAPVFFGNYLYVNTTYVLQEMSVYSTSGRLMARSSTSPVNTRSWARGVYIVTVTTSGGKGRAKVVKK